MFRVLIFASVVAIAGSAPLFANNYYVDFARGSDAGSGSATAPWRHSPGDSAATATAASTALGSGDVVHFAPGVAYRGTVQIKTSGSPQAPIRFVGDSWPGRVGQAIMDGGTLLGAGTPCSSQAACGGAPGWRYIVTYTVPNGTSWTDWLVAGPQLLGVAQYPTQANPIGYDNLDNYIAVPTRLLSHLKAGSIPFTGQAPGPGAALALWTQPNQLIFPAVTVANTTLRFNPAGFIPYKDRPTLYSVVNDPARLGRGQFAVVGHKAFIWPMVAGSAVTIGARREGIFINNSHDISVEGFSFTGFSSDYSSTAGIPILAFGSAANNLLITRNRFGPMALLNGQGFVNLINVGTTTVVGNRFDGNVFGSGIRVADARGPVSIRCNSFAHLGRTGVALLNVFASTIERNNFDGLNGIHGNAITSYLDNRRISINNNVVTNSVRPVTVEGVGTAAPYFADSVPPATTITGNILQTATYKVTGVISWGGGMRNLTMTGNTVIGPGNVSRFQQSDINMVATANTQTPDLSPIAAKQAENAAACVAG